LATKILRAFYIPISVYFKNIYQLFQKNNNLAEKNIFKKKIDFFFSLFVVVGASW
jgi:hypothetical protein